VARSIASIDAEIAAIEALLSSSAGLSTSIGADGVSRTIDRSGLESRLDKLYMQRDRADGSSPMIIRGVVKGL
jgi:hypothetical protein